MSKVKSICNIIQTFMKLNNEHCYIYNSKWFIPKDKGLCVVAGLTGQNIISNNKEHKNINGNFSEVLTITIQEHITINIFSYNMEAIERKEEVLMALNSDYSENLQNKEAFYIGTIPTSFNDVSETDGVKILNRFNININVISKKEIINNVDYYDNVNFLLIKIIEVKMAVDISNVININISTSPTLLSNENVNIIGIFTREKSLFPIDNYAIYKNPNSCMSDWGIDSMTYKMVNNIFSQNLNILAGGGYVVVFPMLDEISLQATAGSYIISNLLLDKWQSVNNGSFTIQVDGGEEKAINNLDFTNAKTLEEVGEIIQASLEDATVSVNKKTLVITSKTTGANSSIVITEGAEGTDLADVDYLNVKQAIEEKGQNAYEGEERLQDAVARTKDYTFYEAILTTFDSADDEVLATAELIQPLNKMFFAVSNKLSDVSSVFDIIRQKSFTKTRCLYYGGEDYKLFASGYASKLLSVNFNGSGTANNLAVKEIIGLLPDNTVNDNLLMQLQETGVDCYANIKGLGTIMTSGANEWSDTVLFLNWLKNALEVAGYNTLRAVPTKIAQTETGVEQLKNSYINVLEQAIRLGYMAPGKWLLPFTFGDQELFYNNIEQVGYYVYSEPIVNQTQNERDKRKAPLIQMAIKLAGAINSSSVIVYVNN